MPVHDIALDQSHSEHHELKKEDPVNINECCQATGVTTEFFFSLSDTLMNDKRSDNTREVGGGLTTERQPKYFYVLPNTCADSH